MKLKLNSQLFSLRPSIVHPKPDGDIGVQWHSITTLAWLEVTQAIEIVFNIHRFCSSILLFKAREESVHIMDIQLEWESWWNTSMRSPLMETGCFKKRWSKRVKQIVWNVCLKPSWILWSIIRHPNSRNWRLNFSFTFREKQAFDTKFKQATFNNWFFQNRPIKHHSVVNFSNSFFIFYQCIHSLRNSVFKLIVDLVDNCISYGSHKRAFDKISNLSKSISVNSYADVVLGKIYICWKHRDCWNYFSWWKSLSLNMDLEAKSHVCNTCIKCAIKKKG